MKTSVITPQVGLVLIALLVGCAAGCRSSPSGSVAEVALHGIDTRVRFIIDQKESITADEAGQVLADQEMCYLTIDKVTIECFPFGSLWMLGRNDAVELVYDNPLDDLHADVKDAQGELILRTLSVLSLVGDSIERLPLALADYIDSDAPPNPGVARRLAHQLLESQQVRIAGVSRSGEFEIVLELTEEGKETIRGALADRESGELRYAQHVHRRLSDRARRASTISARDGVPLPRVWR